MGPTSSAFAGLWSWKVRPQIKIHRSTGGGRVCINAFRRALNRSYRENCSMGNYPAKAGTTNKGCLLLVLAPEPGRVGGSLLRQWVLRHITQLPRTASTACLQVRPP